MSNEPVHIKMQRVFTFDTNRPEQMQLWISSYVSGSMVKRIHDQIFIDNVHWSLNEPYDQQSILITLRIPMHYDEAEPVIADVIKNWYEEECGAERRYRPLHVTFNNPAARPDEHVRPQPLSRAARLGRLRAKMSWALAEEKYELLFLLSGEEKRLKKASSRRY
jgi:hypothetical protein